MGDRSNLRLFDLADPSLELLDPTPDIFAQFVIFNEQFFFNKLGACTVEWSKRLTSCAGICQFHPRSGLCTIRLSEPLLKLRPRKNLIETLLHEMIHAYLFITCRNQDRDGHGQEFQYHMHRINDMAGINITIYHSFHAEVAVYKQHWWRCNGTCQDRAPFYGWVKRAMNRAPGVNDIWWKSHRDTCSGVFIKVKEPEKTKIVRNGATSKKTVKEKTPATPKIDSVFSHTAANPSIPLSANIRDGNITGASSGTGSSVGFARIGAGFRNSVMSQWPNSAVISQKTVSKKRNGPSIEIKSFSQTKIDSFFKGTGHKLGSGVSSIDLMHEDKSNVNNAGITPTKDGTLTQITKRRKPDIIILGL